MKRKMVSGDVRKGLKEGNVELYNLRKDLKESKNLASANPEKAQALLKELVGWRKANSVPLPPSSQLEH